MITTTVTTGPVTVDDARPFLAEYDPANRWNGWIGRVRVDALTLVELFERADGEGIAFRWDGDTPTIVEYEGTEYEETVRVELGDDGLYELGGLGWCFYEPEVSEAVVDDLSDGDVFSLDGGATWHVCCVVLFGTVSVYTDDRRGDDVANVVRIDAERDDVALILGSR